MDIYGHAMGLNHYLYLSVNKDTDEIYPEIFEVDHSNAMYHIERAAHIISDPLPPKKKSKNPSFWKCAMCDFREVCHYDKPFKKSCRTCKNSRPVEGGEWGCILANQVIPKEEVLKGCDHWEQIENV